MSDPEAGDSEGMENPDPEDDAHLSSQSNRADSDDPQLNSRHSLEESSGCCPPSVGTLESDLSESQQNGAQMSSLEEEKEGNSDLSESLQNGAEMSSLEEARGGDNDSSESQQRSADTSALNNSADSSPSEQPGANGALRLGQGNSAAAAAAVAAAPSGAEPNTTGAGNAACWEDSPCPQADQQNPDSPEADRACSGDGSGDGSDTSGAVQKVLRCKNNNEAQQGCGARTQPSDTPVSRNSTTDSSDQDESPPEDELFAAAGGAQNGAPPEDEQFAVVDAFPLREENSADLSAAGNFPVYAQNNVQTESQQACNHAELGAGDNRCDADTERAEPSRPNSLSQVEPSSQAGAVMLEDDTGSGNPPQRAQPSVHASAREISPAADRDSNQIPECDRQPQSSQMCADEASGVAVDAAVSEGATSSDLDHKKQSGNLGERSPGSSPSHIQHAKTHQNNEHVNTQSDGVCHASLNLDCDLTTAASPQNSVPSQPTSASAVTKNLSSTAARGDSFKPSFLEDDSDDEDLLTELDAELRLCSPRPHQRNDSQTKGSLRLPLNGLKDIDPKHSELCKRFEEQLLQLQQTVLQREREISRLKEEKTRQRHVSHEVIAERDKLKAQLAVMNDRNPDDLYLPQIKELEYTINQNQAEVRQLKEKLTIHDSAAKRAINTLQSEMKARIDQITKLYEESSREKDAMVMKFAQAETKTIEAKCAADKLESRVRDLLKEKEFNSNKTRAAMGEKQKASVELLAKTGELETLRKEMEKMKEDNSSTEYRFKWFQNKLKAELEAHKETKGNLEKTTAKLKEAKEETEMIRRDTQAIVKTYQESEEVRSNSLDKELKMKQTELLMKMKEKSETEEVHIKTMHELESLKSKHKDTLEELKTLKDKVQCFEEERMQADSVQNKYQAIIQNQKSDNAGLSKQLTEYQALKEDFDRAQEMIKNLDHEVSELKMSNRDLQKDIESCQARESKMLTLQSELSRSNALLRSENTNLNNQVATLSGETQKMKMDIQDLETRCRNVSDQYQEEGSQRREETSTLSSQLAAKSKESDDYKQKWEDEIDSSKTWKRKHASNVKDLTRQLQHAKKRLEAQENGAGSAERDANSMGSRTNSNGSLNSMDNSNQHGAHNNHHHPSTAPSRGPSQEPEFPVITEQVEVDKQLLIERIVRLQRSLARKNEKLEFLEEHIQQLVSEIKKKNRIIQNYVVREEAGTLASDVMDANKLAVRREAQALLARKGGIMASVYSQHQQDGTMTLDLSLEINKKLQAVLEDTLLKNMTLKDNLDTLGAEIARLSQENRRLQLHMQGLGVH